MNPRALDALRGLAALYVVVYHVTGLLVAGPPQPGAAPLGPFLLNGFSYGQQAVLLFFLISGFCIHYRQAHARTTQLDLHRFAWRRLRRLYPPLVLALAVTAMLDWLGAQQNAAVYNASTAYPTINGWVWGQAHDLPTLSGNLLFQAALLVPTFGSDGPLWSLALEFWFYALYPVLLVMFRRLGLRRALLTVASISMGIQLLPGGLLPAAEGPGLWLLAILRVFSEWPVWVLGALIAESHARGFRSGALRRLGPTSVLLLGAMAALSPIGDQHGRFSDLAWASVVALGLAYLLLEAPAWLTRGPAVIGIPLYRLGDISYSLYLLHFPWLAFLAAWWLNRHAALPDGPELAVVGVGSALGLGWLGWYAVERHCQPRRGRSQSPTAETRVPSAENSVVLEGVGLAVARG